MMQPWEIEELERLRKEQRRRPLEQPLLPLEPPVVNPEDSDPHPPTEEVERGVVILQM